MKHLVVLVILLIAAGTSLAVECDLLGCIALWDPVCGSDGKTYGNECELNIKQCFNPNVTFVHKGVCRSFYNDANDIGCLPREIAGLCTKEYFPVCGSNGKTYPNKCTLCADISKNPVLTLVHTGKCRPKASESNPLNPGCTEAVLNIHCTEDEFPLCGTNGETYGNACKYCKGLYELKEYGKDLNVKHLGQCTPEDYCIPISKHGACPLNYAPVCASNDQTYPNLCAMCAAMYKAREDGEDITLTKVHSGECQQPQHDEKEHKKVLKCTPEDFLGICTKIFAPVCGSNGKSYANKCEFCHHSGTSDTDLTIKHPGLCKNSKDATPVPDDTIQCTENMEEGICTKEYKPICGTDGNTYKNKCLYCIAKVRNGQRHLSIKHMGVCAPEDYCYERSKLGACPYNYMPVCASDGKTYPNLCMMCYQMYKKRQETGNEEFVLRKDHDGTCNEVLPIYNEAVVCRPEDKDKACTREYFPICGSNGLTYPNRCYFCNALYQKQNENPEDEALTVALRGECPQNHKCSRMSFFGACTDDYRPVCGSDGVTYSNDCVRCSEMYRRQKEGENIFIYVQHEGEC